MGFIDTHSHIYGEEFDEDREEVILRAKEAGVEKILLPNINAETIRPMLDLCARHPGYLFPMMGLHPEDVRADYRDVLREMEGELMNPEHPFIAVGEVGLDFYWDKTWYQEQLAALEEQIGWAETYHLPLVIHCRSAHRELVEVMQRHAHAGLKGIFHCFGGTVEEATELLRFEGFMLGIGGVLTYKKSTLPETLRQVPLDRIVIETDAPYLAPVPQRGKRNEPAFALHTLRKVAEVYAVSEEEVMEKTNRAFQCVFCAETRKN